MNTYHFLNGDALTDRIRKANLPGELAICRECLVDGPLTGETLPEFWETRARYLSESYGESEKNYCETVVPQFEQLRSAPKDSEINLWFGYDLFCQANLWFMLSLLREHSNVFVVYPSFLEAHDRWNDFGGAKPEDLVNAYRHRVKVTTADHELGEKLWEAFKHNDLESLRNLSTTSSAVFPYLEEVCHARIEEDRPERAIRKIVADGLSDFSSVFREFAKREGVYGFGDTQVKKIYNRVIS